MIAERDEFKGNAIIRLKKSEFDKYPAAFGLSKAKLVVDTRNATRSSGKHRCKIVKL